MLSALLCPQAPSEEPEPEPVQGRGATPAPSTRAASKTRGRPRTSKAPSEAPTDAPQVRVCTPAAPGQNVPRERVRAALSIQCMDVVPGDPAGRHRQAHAALVVIDRRTPAPRQVVMDRRTPCWCCLQERAHSFHVAALESSQLWHARAHMRERA